MIQQILTTKTFLTIDTTLPANNPKRFGKNFSDSLL